MDGVQLPQVDSHFEGAVYFKWLSAELLTVQVRVDKGRPTFL